MDLPTPRDLRERRKALDLTQSELADRADVSQPLIARIEGGDVDPRLSTLRRIVEALDATEQQVLRASALMNETVVSVAPDDSVREAEDLMESEAYSQLPVLQAGIPVGSISFSDIRHAEGDLAQLPVRDVMSEQFPTVSPDATVEKVDSLLDYYKAVMVTEGGEARGIITEADIAAARS
ncbi:MAG: CBS domain-containing protein [Haloferacaceae archaeon]